jgi:hypothetical protein
MLVSILFLESGSLADLVAGAAGLVASAILLGSGLLTLAILTATASWSPVAPDIDEDV